MQVIRQSFDLGRLVITPAAQEGLPRAEVCDALARHSQGDWGDVCAEDWEANDEALREDARILSAYHSLEGIKFWIITEGDRSATTVLLPDDY